MTLPADMPLSTVAGTFTVAAVDNADTGIDPQGAPLDGLQIILTPEPARIWTHRASGGGIAVGPMVATTNSMGMLVNPVTAGAGLRIPASVQPGLTGAPTIPWTAEITDPLGRVPPETRTFLATAGGTVNLPSAPRYYPDPNAGTLPQWEQAVADAGAAATAALSARIRTGTGRPTGTAPLGTLYIDTAATYGASMWISTAPGDTTAPAWRVATGDTGNADIKPLLMALPSVSACGSAFVRRVGDTVFLWATGLAFTVAGHVTFWTAPEGWRPRANATGREGLAIDAAGTSPRMVSSSVGVFRVLTAQAAPVTYEISASWVAHDPWPTGAPS